MLSFAALFIGSALLSYLLAWPVRALALRFDIVDRPEKRKMHQIPIPLMGGLAIAASFFIVIVTAVVLRPDLLANSSGAFLGLTAGGSIILALGVYDDTRGLGAPVKFAVQVLAAVVVIALGGGVRAFTNPLGSSWELGWLGIPIGIFWIVGVTNAVNLIDGLDGLAVGIGGIAALGLFAVAVQENVVVAGAMLALAGACLGFLRHNFYPARIFLGDTGSMFIGFTLAVVGIHGSLKATTATVLFLPIIVLGVPLFDTLFAIMRRAKRRANPFKADREHIHHRLVRIGLHHRNVVLVLYFVCAYLSLTAYSIAQFPYQTAFLFLVLLTMGGVIGLRTLQFLEERLEAGAAAGPPPDSAARRRDSFPGRTRGHHRPGAGRNADFTSLICVISGFRREFGEPAELRAMCLDIAAMISRRVRILGVRAEPSSPGKALLILRCEPLKDSMAALVMDGIAWYLEEHREKLSSDAGFPRIQWIGSGDAGPVPRGIRQEETPGREPQRIPLKGPAGAVSS